MDVDFAFDHAVAHVVGLAVRQAPFHAAAGHPGTEAFRLMFAAVLLDRRGAAQVLAPRRAAEFAAPENKRVVEQSPLLQILEQPGDRLISLPAKFRQVAANVNMMVPAIHRDLHEPHTGFAELARQEARSAVLIALFCANTVEIEGGLRLFGEIN